jgi:hypothetical protein
MITFSYFKKENLLLFMTIASTIRSKFITKRPEFNSKT